MILATLYRIQHDHTHFTLGSLWSAWMWDNPFRNKVLSQYLKAINAVLPYSPSSTYGAVRETSLVDIGGLSKFRTQSVLGFHTSCFIEKFKGKRVKEVIEILKLSRY